MTKAFSNYRADFKKFSKLNKTTDLKNAEDANEMVV